MSPEVIEQLKQLAQLKDAGVLTQEEFDQQKRKLLSS
jgi:predicted Zn-dependent peptidase